MVVEVRSEGDKTYRKLEFYAALGVREVLVLHPQPRAVELFRLVEEKYVQVSPAADGAVLVETLGLRVAAAPEHLSLTWDGGSAEI